MASTSSELTDEQVLKHQVPWETFVSAGLITQQDYSTIQKFQGTTPSGQQQIIAKSGEQFSRSCLAVLKNVGQDSAVQNVLALLWLTMHEHPERAKVMFDAGELPYTPFLRLAKNSTTWYNVDRAARILTLLLLARPDRATLAAQGYVNAVAPAKGGEEKEEGPSSSKTELSAECQEAEAVLGQLIEWLCGQLRRPSQPKLAPGLALFCLGRLLRSREGRVIFLRQSAVPLLGPALQVTTHKTQVQVYYDACLCVWQLTYYKPALEQLAATDVVTGGLVQVVKGVSKEKVLRVALLALKNILAHSGDKKLPAKLLDWGLHRIVSILMMQKFGDEDIPELLGYLHEVVSAQLEGASSFEQYKREVLSGTLQWSPIHTQRQFWRANLEHFEEKDFQVLRVLLRLLERHNDVQTVAIACSDVANFIDAHPQGRGIVSDLGFKNHVMAFLAHSDPEVKKYALKCVQKLMLSADKLDFMGVKA